MIKNWDDPVLRLPMPLSVTALVRLTKALDAALKESGRLGVIRTNDGGPESELRVYAQHRDDLSSDGKDGSAS